MKWIFWGAAAAVGYTYLGYTAWLWLRSRWSPRPVRSSPWIPSVSIVMVVRNEDALLQHKLENLTQLNYPADRIEMVIVSDGSTDGTNSMLTEFAKSGAQVIFKAQPQGKAAGLNDAIKALSGEVVVFTDARQEIEPDALHLLVENFADPHVGCASGELMLGDFDSEDGSQSIDVYWRIEKNVAVLWWRHRDRILVLIHMAKAFRKGTASQGGTGLIRA